MTPTSLEDVRATHDSDKLYDIFDAYCAEHSINIFVEDGGYFLSPDDILPDYVGTDHEPWLRQFINHLEAVQSEEDFELACKIRGEG
jgi:hypothetical protein